METLSSCRQWSSYFTNAHLLEQSLVTLGSLTVTNVTLGERAQLWMVKVSHRNAVLMKLEMAWILTASDFSTSLALWLWTFWASVVKEGKELTPILTMKWLQRLCSVLVFSNKFCAYSSPHVSWTPDGKHWGLATAHLSPGPFCLTYLQPPLQLGVASCLVRDNKIWREIYRKLLGKKILLW